jgi:hypothetical protein
MRTSQQTTDTVLMVKPMRFGYNHQTAASNAFQQAGEACAPDEVQTLAEAEFEAMVAILRQHGVQVIVVNDTPEPPKPDAIFPNNWVSFHEDGRLVLYPMEAENRRWERRRSILDFVGQAFEWQDEVDLSHYEHDGQYLEGTGSMVLDRDRRICYACLSSRTDQEVLQDFARKMGYEIVAFDATDEQGRPIYHTNVLMCVATQFVVICLDALRKPQERQILIEKIVASGKEIVPISYAQMQQFAGNMLELHNESGEKLLVMSRQAFRSLEAAQIQQIEKYARIVAIPLETIEHYGGGSARCMMAAIHLPKKI